MARSTKTGGREATQGVIAGRVAISVGKPESKTPEGFSWIAMSDVARLESGHTPSRRVEDYWNGDVPWIGIRDATGNHGRTIFDTEQHVTQMGLDNSSARLLPAGTVCLSRTASVGYVVSMGVPMATSQDFVNWVCGPELNPKYLQYALVLEQESIRRFSRGSTHQTMYYPEAKALHLLAPERSRQDAIVEVLGALDDKIAANAREVGLADDLAGTLFAAALAVGSEERHLGDVATFHNRRRVPLSSAERGARPGVVPYFGAAGRLDYVDEALFDEHLLLVGEDGSVVQSDGRPVTQYIWGPSWVNNHAHVLTGDGITTELLRLAVRRSSVLSLVTGAVQPKISMGSLKTLQLELPMDGQRDLLAEQVDALAAVLRAKTDESRSLAATRDALLPLLMSGKVTVRDAESVVEGVV